MSTARRALYIVPALTAICFLAFGFRPGEATESGTGEAVAAAARQASDADPFAETMEKGRTLYLVNCRLCHGSRGTAGTPLADNEKLGDAAYVTRTILTGPGYMTGFAEHLDDDEIAAIVTFVRNSWGNDFGAVTAEAVASRR